MSRKTPDARALLVAALCAKAIGKSDDARNYIAEAVGRASTRSRAKDAIADLLDMGFKVRKPLAGVLDRDDELLVRFDACLALGHTTLAYRLALRDAKPEAAQACRTALKLTPDRADVQKAAGHVFLKIGMPDEGVRCYSKAAELEPERGTNHGNFGWALYLAGRYDDAMAASLRALEVDPKLVYVHANVGLLHVLKRDLDEAVPCYARAAEFALKDIERIAVKDLLDLLKKRPEAIDAHYALGFCYEKKGDRAKAREHYQRYVDAAKEGEFVEDANRRIAELEVSTK